MIGHGFTHDRVTTMSITPEEVAYTARLARLRLTADELERFGRDLARVTEYISQLNEALQSGAETDLGDRLVATRGDLRSDEINQWFDPKRVLEQAPDAGDNLFRVPKVIG